MISMFLIHIATTQVIGSISVNPRSTCKSFSGQNSSFDVAKKSEIATLTNLDAPGSNLSLSARALLLWILRIHLDIWCSVSITDPHRPCLAVPYSVDLETYRQLSRNGHPCSRHVILVLRGFHNGV